MSIEVSGHCPHCTLSESYVFHDTPWCPRFFATADVDTNCSRGEGSNGGTIRLAITEAVSRPVEVGELVWLVDCGDGVEAPFATWGRVVSKTSGIVYFEEVGTSWVYVRPAPPTVSR